MTALEWLIEQMKINNYISKNAHWLIDDAKEMEKQQLKEMYLKGIENYDPTFNKICEHCYITSADWKSQTCTKCNHRINL